LSVTRFWLCYRAEKLCGRACLFSLLNSYQILEKLFERGEKLSDKCQAARPFFPLSHEGLDKMNKGVYTPNYERTDTSTERSSIG
jgi:hypothetical protein